MAGPDNYGEGEDMPITNLNVQIQEVERHILETTKKLNAQQKLRRNLVKALECAGQAGMKLFDQQP